ncbi:MAG: D-alanyl-D-alanine carboxypeptidase, partial [Halothermotrichaceae bacterium]
MLKKLSLLSVFFVLGFSLFIFNSDVFAVNNYYQERISAHSAVLIDVETGQVLYNKNMNVKSFPASTTKILTTIIAIEECDLKETVTVSRKAAYQEGSSIY